METTSDMLGYAPCYTFTAKKSYVTAASESTLFVYLFIIQYGSTIYILGIMEIWVFLAKKFTQKPVWAGAIRQTSRSELHYEFDCMVDSDWNKHKLI